MANLIDSASFSASVPSLHVDDAVRGATTGNPNEGVSNAPNLALANRTKYLKAVVDAIGLPVFGLIGKQYITWDYSALKLYVYGETISLDSGLGASFLANVIQVDAVIPSPGITILHQAFIKPYGYNKLTLTFLARSNINIGSARGVRTFVFPFSATVNLGYDEPVASNLIQGATLAADPYERSAELDLTSVPAGTPLILLHTVSLAPLSSFVLDFNLVVGQIRSSWGN
jgi:hypothetical protein